MSQAILQQVEASQMKTDLPPIAVGDNVDVHYRIIEGDKQRIQVFSGVVIKKQGKGLTATFTVRRIVANEGVERTFPLHSPKIAKLEVKRHAHTRRSKLYFLRDRVGKARRLPDRQRGLHHLEGIIAKPQKKKQGKKGKGTEAVEDETSDAPVQEASVTEESTDE